MESILPSVHVGDQVSLAAEPLEEVEDEAGLGVVGGDPAGGGVLPGETESVEEEEPAGEMDLLPLLTIKDFLQTTAISDYELLFQMIKF